ncbi:hypothetical protein VaNZ11_000625 [Volvox africanus]|uniref:Uncharacterized protein n=1 Tax=Volvox africanus TaxID=51714 RepID=A0ABQ5RMQ9_9CHLO|nr:hypothetical protein VaNZ11_000625 [Volvox africanus]
MAAPEYPASAAPPSGKIDVSPSPKITKLPGDVQPEVQQLISTIKAYKAATDWDRIDETTRALDADCVYDLPFMYITGGRDRVRAVAKLLALLGRTDFEPKLVHFLINSTARTAELEMEGTLHVIPRRYWFAPITWLLPPIRIAGTITLRVKSLNDQVALVQERYSNIPVLIPRLVRWFAGWTIGALGVIAEPTGRTLYTWFMAGYNTVQSGGDHVAQQHPQAAAVASKVKEIQDKAVTEVAAVRERVAATTSE